MYFTIPRCTVNVVGKVWGVVVSAVFGLLYSGAKYKYSGY
jgi:hypothetical protein